MIDIYIKQLIQYAIREKLIDKEDEIYCTNRILKLLNKTDYTDPEFSGEAPELYIILKNLLDISVKQGLIADNITERDIFDTQIMDCITPFPSAVRKEFWKRHLKDPREATDFYYNFSRKTNYIREDRIRKDLRWTTDSAYGKMDITINLSKPEKDPKKIIEAKNLKTPDWPRCRLCPENEGYAGRMDYPARSNHRIIPITLGKEPWGFQYSPYTYYNEHCIVFSMRHTPMKINRCTFVRLFEFIEMFPHYFIGSNADLPIVGGSILNHNHFQGGNYKFAMTEAETLKKFDMHGYPGVSCEILKWPLSVIRLKAKDYNEILSPAEHILNVWKEYDDESAFIYSHTGDAAHNTVTPIARFERGMYELDIVLRNNITTKEHPLGVFHPHENLHNIKKENIGLIEVMGLAVLPARLKKEMELVAEYILAGKEIAEDSRIKKHANWVKGFLSNYSDLTPDTIMSVLRKEIGNTFVRVLEDSGVFKCTDKGYCQFMRFVDSL